MKERPPSKGGFRKAVRYTGVAVRLLWEADRKTVTLTTALQVVGGVGLVAMFLIGRDVLRQVLVAPDVVEGITQAAPLLGLLLAVFAVLSFAAAATSGTHKLLAERTMRHFQDRILRVAGDVALDQFESAAFYDRLRRAQENGSMTPLHVSLNLPMLSGGAIRVAGIIVALAAMQPILIPLVLVAAIPLWVTTSRNTEEMYSFSFGNTPGDRVRQHLSALLTSKEPASEVRAFSLQEFLRRRWNELYDERLNEAQTMVKRFVRRSLLASVASTFITGLSIATLLILITMGRMDAAGAAAAMVALQQLSSALQIMGRSAGALYESTMHLEDYTSFLEMQRTLKPNVAPIKPFSNLEVKDVRFTYPGSTTPALDGASMQVRAGEVIALVGENGSGKTTLAKLLAHLYSPDAGTIEWDGRDTASFDREAISANVAVIFQDFVRYRLLASENIGVGNVARIDDLSEIVAASKAAGSDEFIMSLANGYDTQLGKEFKDGAELSVGQWQRMALARAFFRDAPFIILDEPTASLDARAEHELFKSIAGLSKGRAVLLISHRFSTVRPADRIYVLHHGKIIEEGTHGDLMGLGGMYAEMFSLQASSYIDDPRDLVDS